MAACSRGPGSLVQATHSAGLLSKRDRAGVRLAKDRASPELHRPALSAERIECPSHYSDITADCPSAAFPAQY